MGRKQYAPKGQKYIAQGSALGRLIPNNNAPCKGKSIDDKSFCPCRAQDCASSLTQGVALGYVIIGLSARIC